MHARKLLVAAVVVAVTAAGTMPAAASAATPQPSDATAVAAKKKCKKGKVRRGKRCVRRPGRSGPATPITPATPVTPQQQTPQIPSTPGAQLTPDDAAVQQAMANGVLLERSEWGSVTATYYRLFFRPGGAFKTVTVDWNQVSGERCSQVTTGTWSLVNGYRFDAQGGGLVAVVQINSASINGTEILIAYGRDPSHVYVGRNEQQWDVNPNMLDGC